MRTLSILSLVVAGLLSGCSMEYEPGYWSDETYYDEDPYTASSYTEGAIEVHTVQYGGDLGWVYGFDGHVWKQEGYGWEGYSQVEIQAEATGEWAVMTLVEVDGGFSGLEVGRTYTFDGWGDGWGESHVRIMGCSGPQADVWEYDTYAEEVQVQVHPATRPGFVHIVFVAWFDDYEYGRQTVEGSFEVQVH